MLTAAGLGPQQVAVRASRRPVTQGAPKRLGDPKTDEPGGVDRVITAGRSTLYTVVVRVNRTLAVRLIVGCFVLSRLHTPRTTTRIDADDSAAFGQQGAVERLRSWETCKEILWNSGSRTRPAHVR